MLTAPLPAHLQRPQQLQGRSRVGLKDGISKGAQVGQHILVQP
jgi:hypothetical protein